VSIGNDKKKRIGTEEESEREERKSVLSILEDDMGKAKRKTMV
jgi:hypothetical protein